MSASQNRPVAGLLLAGGKSSRMGQDKALLSLNGETLINRTWRVLKRVQCQPVLICGQRPGGIADIYPGHGPLSGIHAGLRVLRTHVGLSRVVVVPVDMPRLSKALLQPLLAHPTSKPVHYQHAALPCVLPVTDELMHYLQNALVQDYADHSVMALLREFKAEVITAPDANAMLNTNTPEQWQRLLKENANEYRQTV